MSHRAPFRASASPPPPSSFAQHLAQSGPPAYASLHASMTRDDSSSDDDAVDPRWTSRRVHQRGAQATPLQPGGTEASPATHHTNFTRQGYTPTANPLDTSTGTTRVPGRTTHSAKHVEEQWKKGLGDIDSTAYTTTNTSTTNHSATHGGTGGETFSAIPVPTVDLTGMTDEQRELLEYYQARVDAFDRERVDFLHRLDEMSGNSREKHSLKWDLHKKDEQMMDLQKALSDAHVFLYEERAQVLKLTAENDRLKIQEMEDRQRLEHLLALTQPINQEVTYFRECRPEKLTKNYPGQRDDIYSQQRDLSAVSNAVDSPRRQVLHTSRTSTNNTSGGGNSSFLAHSQSASQFGSQSARRGVVSNGKASTKKKSSTALRPVVRTIYLPNENIDILKQIVASLRAQLTEQHTLFEQRIQALQEDRAIREQETAEVQRKANMHMQELSKELQAVNDLNKLTTRDYLELRHAAQLAERKLKERASHLSQQQFDLQKHLKAVETKAAVSENALQNENASYVSMFRQQTAATEEDLAIMKAQYAATQDLYEKRIRYLESRIVTVKGKLSTVSERRSLELGGYTTDITHLREKVRKLEQTMVNFKAHQLGALSAEYERSPRRARSDEKQHSPQLPPRISATFELLGEDVRQLQSELSQMARKINST